MDYDRALSIWTQAYPIIQTISDEADESSYLYKDGIDALVDDSDMGEFYDSVVQAEPKELSRLLNIQDLSNALQAVASVAGIDVDKSYIEWLEAQRQAFQEAVNNIDYRWEKALSSSSDKAVEDFRKFHYGLIDEYRDAAVELGNAADDLADEL